MSIFDYTDYREFLKVYIENQPRKGWGIISKFAEELDMSQAHVSQVLAGQKDFSLEQAYKLCKFLKLTSLESDYFIQTVQFSRAGTSDLKEFFKAKIDSLKIEALKVKNHMNGFLPLTESEMNVFYSSWLYSAIRMHCSVGKGANFENIVSKFNVAPKDLTVMLAFMTEKGLLEKDGILYRLGAQRTLVSKGSPQNLMHSKNWRLQSINRSEKAREGDIFLTSPMSLSKADFEIIRNELLEVIKNVSKRVADSPAEEVVCLNIDLFEV